MAINKLTVTCRGLLGGVLLSMACAADFAYAGFSEGMDALSARRFDQARAHFEAEPQNPDAVYQLALLARNGLGEAKNESRAAELLKRAADLGHERATLAYAYALGQGTGVAKDGKQALELLGQLAAKGNVTAMTTLGHAYSGGWWGQPVNATLGCDWYEKTMDKSPEDVRQSLAFCYLLGQGREKDEPRGLDLLRAGAAAEDPSSLASLATISNLGQHGLAKDLKQGLDYAMRAAKLGNRLGRFEVGLAHYEGQVVAKNRREAARWFDAAANQGHYYSQAYLAAMFRVGDGVPKNVTEAYKWYTLAINNPGAQKSQLENLTNMRGRLASDMQTTAVDEGLRRAREFVVQRDYRMLDSPLPDLPTGSEFKIDDKSFRVPAVAGYVNGASLANYTRQSQPNNPGLVNSLYALVNKDDQDAVRLGARTPVRSILFSRYSGQADGPQEVSETAFNLIKQTFSEQLSKMQSEGVISKLKTVSSDANSMVVTRTHRSQVFLIESIGLFRIKGKLMLVESYGHKADQQDELEAFLKDFGSSLVRANKGFFD